MSLAFVRSSLSLQRSGEPPPPPTEPSCAAGAPPPALVDPLRPRRLPDGSFAMSPAQEVVNALTMLIPAACALKAESMPLGTGAHVVAAAILIHFPFSFSYHLACAFRPERHPVVGNAWCKGDLIAIHLAGATMALGTSGSVFWLALNLAFNLVCAYRTLTWASSQLERRLCRVLCAAGYIVPIGLRSSAAFYQACFFFVATALPFACNTRLGGWGHSISHVVLGPFATSIVSAAATVEAPFSEGPAALVETLSRVFSQYFPLAFEV